MKVSYSIIAIAVCLMLTFGNHVMLPRHFPAFYAAYPFFALLLSFALALLQTSAGAIAVLSIVALARRNKKRCERTYTASRLIAFGIDCFIAFVLGVVVMVLVRPVMSYRVSLSIVLFTLFSAILLRDAVTSTGSIGKRTMRLFLWRDKSGLQRVGFSMIRNFVPSLFCILTLIAAGDTFRDNDLILTVHLLVSLALGLDLIVLWRRGSRPEDILLGIYLKPKS